MPGPISRAASSRLVCVDPESDSNQAIKQLGSSRFDTQKLKLGLNFQMFKRSKKFARPTSEEKITTNDFSFPLICLLSGRISPPNKNTGQVTRKEMMQGQQNLEPDSCGVNLKMNDPFELKFFMM